MVSTSAPKLASPETVMEVAPGEFPIELFKSRSPVIEITSNGRLLPPTIPLMIKSAVVPLLFASRFMVKSLGVSELSLLTVPLKVMLLSVVVNVTSVDNTTAPLLIPSP